MKTSFFRVFLCASLLALAFGAALPISASADEGDPPPTQPSELPADEAVVADEEAPAGDIGSGEAEDLEVVEQPIAGDDGPGEIEPPVVEEETSEQIDTEEAKKPVVEDTAGLILADMPEDTELVVLGEDGEPLSLASQEAAEVIAAGDPMWCPLGTTPGSASCSPGFGSFNALVDWLYSQNGGLGPNANGVIWIEANYDSSVSDPGLSWYLDGETLTNMATKSLTIKGGWSGANNTTIIANDPSVFNGSSLAIYGWKGDITLSDVIFTNGPWDGLYIDTEGKVTLTRVDATNNAEDGVEIYNDYPAKKDVVISDGDFSNNGTDPEYGGNGLSIYSSGTITLANVTASGNQMSDWYDYEWWYEDEPQTGWRADGGNGARLLNWDGKGVIVTDSLFEANEGDGLFVYSYGAITLTRVVASGNLISWFDADPDPENEDWYSHGGNGADVSNWVVGKGVIVNDSTFEYNDQDGLHLSSFGGITVKDITSIGNWGTGAYLDNCTWDWDLELCTGTGGVTLTGTNIFGENDNTGLYVNSAGAIKINNLIANANGWRGAYLDNCNWVNFAGACLSAQPVTLTGTNEFKFNGRGLFIYSGGLITLNNVNASNNYDLYGARLWNVDSPLVTNPGVNLTGTNTFNENGGYGLDVYSRGAIKINNLTANGNYMYCDEWDEEFEECLEWTAGHGVYLDNSFDTKTPVTITVSGGNPDTEFKNNEGTGVIIYSTGPISLTGVVAEGNSYGGYLNNDWAGAVGGITVGGWGAGFFGNVNNGLEVYSRGAITMTHLYAWGNGGFGALLDNSDATTPMAVKLTGSSSFGNNEGGDGLVILSQGAISLNTLYAYNNAGLGAVLDNSFNPSGQTVTLIGASHDFNNNQESGLMINSYGVVSIANLAASDNWNFGALLDNFQGDGIKLSAVTLTGNNSFQRNGSTGLEVYSKGTVTLNNVRAYENGGFGVYVDNCGLEINDDDELYCENNAFSPVKLTGYVETGDNEGHGLRVWSKGAISVSKMSAWGNSGHGAWLFNAFNPASPQLVTITGFANLENNFQSGVEIHSYGAITVTNVTADGNGWGYWDVEDDEYGYGAKLINHFADGSLALGGFVLPIPDSIKPMPVTLNGTNSFRENWTGGLFIDTLGAIKANNLDARSNGFGIQLDNSAGTAAVTITGYVMTTDNDTFGMDVFSRGAITINVNDAWVVRNGWEGWYLDNTTGVVGVGPGVTLNSANSDWAFDFWDNGYYGLTILSNGAIKVTGLDAGSNGWVGAGSWGAYLNNSFEGAVGTVTITAPTSGDNYFGSNWGRGLLVFSNGAITIGNLVARDNGWYCTDEENCIPVSGLGAHLDNSSSPLVSLPGVTLTGFGDFSWNADTGLVVLSKGIITLNNIDANNNGQYNVWALEQEPEEDTNPFGWGVYLDNCGFDEENGCTDTPKGRGITLNGTNNFSGNFQDGLWATSYGAIKGNNLQANDNWGRGAYIDNQWGQAGTASVVLTAPGTAWNSFDNNGGLGIEVWSHGAITLSNISANGNWNGGAYLDTWGQLAPQSVTLLGRNWFNDNHNGTGLTVAADGNITTNNLTAGGNADGDGVYLNNCLWADAMCNGTGNIAVNGVNTFNGNGYTGLYTESHGNITMNKVTADRNGGRGVYGTTDGNIILACASMTRNDYFGWELQAGGSVTLKGVFALGNNFGGGNTQLNGGTLVTNRGC